MSRSRPAWKNLYGLPIYDHPETPRHLLSFNEIRRRENAGLPIRDPVSVITRADGSRIVMIDPEFLSELGKEEA